MSGEKDELMNNTTASDKTEVELTRTPGKKGSGYTPVSVSLSGAEQGEYASLDEVEKKDESRAKLITNLKIMTYFALWYALNLGYNITNKRVAEAVPLYWLLGAVQLLIGSIYALTLWVTGLRKAPELTWDDIKALLPIALFNTMGHLGATVSLGSGAVSFTHIIKSGEPVFTSLLSALLLRQFFKWPVYLALVPIIVGVAVASVSELEFGWMSFSAAMVSNVAMSLRAIYSKVKMGKPVGKNMTPSNLYGVVTILSLFIGMPLCFAVEGWKAHQVYADNTRGEDQTIVLEIWTNMLLSGLTFFLYNEVAFLALSQVHPITHAVGNTIKRVVIIVVSIIVFQNPVTTSGAIGCTVAILGTFVYSLAKQRFA